VSGVLLRRTKGEALDLPKKVRSWQPVSISAKKILQLETRALEYLEANPARNGPTWITVLGLLNRARHEQAVARVQATVEASVSVWSPKRKSSSSPATRRVLVGNIHAAGTGITLTAATHLPFNDLDRVAIAALIVSFGDAA
jgi:hypothetical protein